VLRVALAFACLSLMVPVASADHWGDQYSGPNASTPIADSTCPVLLVSQANAECVARYLCLEGSPPQIVDTALHCGSRAASRAVSVAAWAPQYAWWTADERSEIVENVPADLNQTLVAEQTLVNDVLCGTVWSQFCALPVWLPDHVPVSDPIRYFPL
jgi:hypothetical protein